jgi:hypothetical protein
MDFAHAGMPLTSSWSWVANSSCAVGVVVAAEAANGDNTAQWMASLIRRLLSILIGKCVPGCFYYV